MKKIQKCSCQKEALKKYMNVGMHKRKQQNISGGDS